MLRVRGVRSLYDDAKMFNVADHFQFILFELYIVLYWIFSFFSEQCGRVFLFILNLF